MFLEILVAGIAKLVVSLLVFYAVFSMAAKILSLRFADAKATAKLVGLLAATAFFFDLPNFYVLLYSGWSELTKAVILLFLLSAYLSAALFSIWYLYRDTHKKTVYAWLMFLAAYLLEARMIGLCLSDLFSLLGL